ncbi:MAG: 2-polyprenyl-3-methyl-5-hydroxy-6-metoxy-1,4-benzoquinol methylase [Planctomycetota bacterium]|jgi:2-polyprenyl-3-methyl-5-hydroxy-6-metoxy-1,4-benzoquinol methylase
MTETEQPNSPIIHDGFQLVSCNYCGADDYSTVVDIDKDYEYDGIIDAKYALRSFRMVRCNQCSLVYINPQPTQAEVMHYYPSGQYCCFAQLPPKGLLMSILYRMMVSMKRRAVMPSMPDDGVLLDFGCGTGHWLVALKQGAKPGQRFIGIDASEGAIDKLKAAGIEAYVGDDQVLLDELEENSVDVILLTHVIEHVPDPKQTLARLARVLKPGGVIHGVTPNVDAWDTRRYGKYWGGWHAPRHFILFDDVMLRKYVSEADLEFDQLTWDMEGASHWAVSMHTKLAEKKGFRPSPTKWRMGIYPLFLLISMPIGIIQKLLSKTSVMSFVLRKP